MGKVFDMVGLRNDHVLLKQPCYDCILTSFPLASEAKTTAKHNMVNMVKMILMLCINPGILT